MKKVFKKKKKIKKKFIYLFIFFFSFVAKMKTKVVFYTVSIIKKKSMYFIEKSLRFFSKDY